MFLRSPKKKWFGYPLQHFSPLEELKTFFKKPLYFLPHSAVEQQFKTIVEGLTSNRAWDHDGHKRSRRVLSFLDDFQNWVVLSKSSCRVLYTVGECKLSFSVLHSSPTFTFQNYPKLKKLPFTKKQIIFSYFLKRICGSLLNKSFKLRGTKKILANF